MTTSKTTPTTHTVVRHGLIQGKKPAEALQTLATTCTTGAGCPQVQADLTSKQALAGLQTAVTTSQASQDTKVKLFQQYMAASKTAAQDFQKVGCALTTYESAVSGIAGGSVAIITAAGCLGREEGRSSPLELEPVSNVKNRLGKLACQTIVEWPAAPGATSYAIEVNLTPQNPTAPYTALNSGTSRRRVLTAPAPGAQMLVRVASLDSQGNQSAWSAAILATAR